MTNLPDGMYPNKNNPMNQGNYSPNPYLSGIQDSQNLSMGITAGLATAIVGGILWAVISYYTRYQSGFMAIGVGFLVGLSIRHFGKGKDLSFSIAGAFLSLIGCLLGNIFTICTYISVDEGIGIFEVLADLDYATIPDILMATFEPMDALFYGLAIYQGFKSSVIRTAPTGKTKKQ